MKQLTIIRRQIEPRVLKALEVFPVVYVNGPRQAGKTTLVRTLLSDHFKGRFVTFDDALERSAAVRNPVTYLRQSGYPLTVDEVQMVPDIFRPLKMLVDEQRFAALQGGGVNPNGRYLLTGSANLFVIPQLADAMVGRMGIVTLLPLSAGEYFGSKGNFIARCLAKDFVGITKDDRPICDVMRVATYPELVQMPHDMVASWFQNYVNKITLEDPKHIYNLEKAEYMPLLLQALAARAGNLVNDADISRDVGLTSVTARIYRRLLHGTFVTHHLSPWFRNVHKRLVKAGKIYFYDTMLLSYLLKSTPQELAKAQPERFGHLLENFVLSELTKINNTMDNPVDFSFYRTRDGKEVDFVLEQGQKIIGIEVKNSEQITGKHLAGLKELQSIAGKSFVCGVVLCNTSRVIPFGENLYLVPISALWADG